ncbi:MAG: energy transducer TonB [Terriglobales bacterium]
MRFFWGALLSIVIISATNAQTTNEHQKNERITIRCDPPRGVFTPELFGNFILRTQPMYPREALAKGVHGLVRVRQEIGKDGVPQKFEVLSGPSELVNVSLDAVRRWRYRPYKLNGEPVAVEMTCDINFEILPAKPVAGTSSR